MYIRLKRRNETIFLWASPSDTFTQLKVRIADIHNMEASCIMLLASDKKRELVDLSTLSDMEIKNDDVVYMVFIKESGGGWEELQVDNLQPFGNNGIDEGK